MLNLSENYAHLRLEYSSKEDLKFPKDFTLKDKIKESIFKLEVLSKYDNTFPLL